MHLNPILIKEMRTRMRGKLAFFVLTTYVFVLSGVILLYFLGTRGAPPAVFNKAGFMLTFVLMLVQMGLICLVAPTFSASAISSEREQETFDLLDSFARAPVDDSRRKSGRGALLPVSHNVRLDARNHAHLLAGRRRASRSGDFIPADARRLHSVLLDQFLVVLPDTARRDGHSDEPCIGLFSRDCVATSGTRLHGIVRKFRWRRPVAIRSSTSYS